MSDFLFTSESVSEGHPDKVADQISDAVLDAILTAEPAARVAAETLYQELLDAGMQVLLDDREVRPGVMFADMELIGIPHRVVLAERTLDTGQVEYKGRRDNDSTLVARTRLLSFLRERLTA